MAKGLSFNRIWFKSINNFLRYSANREIGRQMLGISITVPLQLVGRDN